MSKLKPQSRLAMVYRFSLLASLGCLLLVFYVVLVSTGFLWDATGEISVPVLALAFLLALLSLVHAIWINRLRIHLTAMAVTRKELEEVKASQDLTEDAVSKLTTGLGEAHSAIEDVAASAKELERSQVALSSRLNASEAAVSELVDAVAVGRLADVEHIAISAALLAASPAELSESVHLPASQHGHALMIRELFLDSARDCVPAPEQNVHLLEIGTTRERWWEQMSTHRLAAVCRALHLKLQTIDVDPVGLKAVHDIESHYPGVATGATERGELFLENWEGALPPYIYLDGYDFDHPGHSKERQERYLELQGEAISDEACWEMHLRCARAFVAKCPSGGKVVFDDAFFDGESWSGKAKTAIPFMLENGFEIVCSTRSTVLLRKL